MRQRAVSKAGRNSGLMTVVRSVGSTLGAVVRTAEDVADDLRHLKTTLSPGEIRQRLAGARRSANNVAMPKKKQVGSVATKEQRVYERIKATSGRSSRSAKAARTAMKRHKSKGHAKGR